ncbi:unnamed protein product, partial [Symbiodinium necroappetens]
PESTAPSTAPEEPATKQQLPTHLLTAIRDFNKADLQTTQQPESESGVIPPTATGEETVPVRQSKQQLPTHLLTAIRDFNKADLQTTQQPESESGVIPPTATGEETVPVRQSPESFPAEPRSTISVQSKRSNRDSRSFLDDIKAQRFALKAVETTTPLSKPYSWRAKIGKEPSTTGEGLMGALSAGLAKVRKATHGDEEDEDEDDGEFVCGWRQPQGATGSPPGAVRGGPDAFSYNLVIKKTCDGSSWQGALCLLKEMDEQQLVVDMLTYHMVMTAQMNGLHWAECLATLQAMEEAQVDDPGILAYGPAVGACLRTLQWEQALLIGAVLSFAILVFTRGTWLTQAFWQSNACDSLFGPPPDETTCNAALAACARGARWQWALDLLPRSEFERPERPEALGCVLEALQLSAKWHQAMELWALQPKPNVICTSSVLLACSRAQRWPQVAALQEDSAGALMEASQDLHRGVLELAHANIVVALLDALEYRDREAAAFRKTLYEPAKRQLVQLSRAAALPELMAGEAVLRCKLLERQSSLGRFFVHRFCSERFGSPSKAVQAKAAKASRRAMAQAGGIWDERPVAKHILAWVECRLPWLSGSELELLSVLIAWLLAALGSGSSFKGARLGGHRVDHEIRSRSELLPLHARFLTERPVGLKKLVLYLIALGVAWSPVQVGIAFTHAAETAWGWATRTRRPPRPEDLEAGAFPVVSSLLISSSKPFEVIPVVGRRYPDEIFSALRGAGCLAGKPGKPGKIAADVAAVDASPDPASQLLELRCCLPVAERGALA